MHIHISDLAREVTEADLRQAFGAFGLVTGVTISKEKVKGKTKVFGYVDMPDNMQAQTAIDNLKGKNLKGKPLKLDKSRSPFRRHRDGGKRGGCRRSAGDKLGGTRSSSQHF